MKIKLNIEVKKEVSYVEVVKEVLKQYINEDDVEKLMYLIAKRWKEVKENSNEGKGYV